MSVVILGGTSEARALAGRLAERGVPVWTSLAGRTDRPAQLPGRVRTGGFGGLEPMLGWLAEVGATALVDATHPFARGMTERVARVAARGVLPVVRLDRPGWAGHPDAARWRWVDDAARATQALEACRAGTALLAVGRQEVASYCAPGRAAVARVIDPPDEPLPPQVRLVRARGPYTRAGERAFFDEHGIRVVVTKDAGGSAAVAKLDVAAERGLDVVIVRRPPLPAGLGRVAEVGEALAWLEGRGLTR